MPVIRIALTTWNVGGAPSSGGVPRDAAHLLRGLAPDASLIVVGLQEVPRPSRGWKAAFLKALPPRWSVISGSRYMGMRVVVLAADGVRGLVEPLRTMRLGSGVGDRWPNKGAVAVVVRVGRATRCCFVVAHLAAQEGKAADRELDYRKIMRRLESEDTAHGSANIPLFLRYEHLFLMGDLNYRIVVPLPERTPREQCVSWVESRLKARDWAELTSCDELVRERNNSNVFVNYQEGPLRFPPTFKFEPGTGTYDLGRLPSYCDRILWHSLPARRPMISQATYVSVPSVMSSDHQPVRAVFDMKFPRQVERASLSSSTAKRLVLEFCAVRFKKEDPEKKGAEKTARSNPSRAKAGLVTSAPARSSASSDLGGSVERRTPSTVHGLDDERSSLSSSSSSSSSSLDECDSDSSSSSDDSSGSSSDSRGESEDGRFVEAHFSDTGAEESATVNTVRSAPRSFARRKRRSSSFDDSMADRFHFRESRSRRSRSPSSQGRSTFFQSVDPSDGDLDSSDDDAPAGGAGCVNSGASRLGGRFDKKAESQQPPTVPPRFQRGVSQAAGDVLSRSQDGNLLVSRHLRSSSGPCAMQVCYSGEGGLTTDGTDEPVKRDSLTQSLSQVDKSRLFSKSKAKKARKKPSRLKKCIMMDVHGSSVFLKPKRIYRAELRKRKDGYHTRSGLALPAIPLHPVANVKELMEEHVQISFWGARSRAGRCGVLPLADVINHALAEGGAKDKYGFELQLTKYGKRVGTLEATVRLVVSDSNLWVDGEKRVVEAEGRYRGNRPVRKQKSAESLSSKAARTAHSARAAKSRVAHRMDSLGSERADSPASRR